MYSEHFQRRITGKQLLSGLLSLCEGALAPKLVLMLKVGVCGGFTTFSTFAFEANKLMQSGSTGLALIYALLSITLGVAAIFLAQSLVH